MGVNRFVRAGIVGLFALLVLISPGAAQRTGKNCSDFKTQPEAQAYFEGKGGSRNNNVDGLDGDRDGIACESLPAGAPKEAGFPWLIASGGVAAAAGAAAFGIRRRTRSRLPSSVPAPSIAAPAHQFGAPTSPAATVTSPPFTDSQAEPVNITINNVFEQKQSGAISSSAGRRLTPEEFKAMPYEQYLQTPYWQTVRRNAIARAGDQCTDPRCPNRGRPGMVLEVHHLSYEYIGMERNEYLVVLCSDCHRKRHAISSPRRPYSDTGRRPYQA